MQNLNKLIIDQFLKDLKITADQLITLNNYDIFELFNEGKNKNIVFKDMDVKKNILSGGICRIYNLKTKTQGDVDRKLIARIFILK